METSLKALALKVTDWDPIPSHIQHLQSLLPTDEATRINKFHFRIDQLRALAGQILIRRVCQMLLPQELHGKLEIQRSSYGKPYLASPIEYSSSPSAGPHSIQFNLSHHGDWVVAVGCRGHRIGLDVSKVELHLQNVDEYLECFDTQFTASEWAHMRRHQQEGGGYQGKVMHAFARMWCLKEAYIKGVGLGLSMDLKDVEFKVDEGFWDDAGKEGNTEVVERGVRVAIKGQLMKNWDFQVGYLDDLHPYAVAIETSEDADVVESEANVVSQMTFQRIVDL
ncbi:hypothetical protein HDV05_004258 [Chytridiales sp. JEL 0842]|nr:hypothetical protein HDV05_004258 [Chytridiales sp. JEL 0842]